MVGDTGFHGGGGGGGERVCVAGRGGDGQTTAKLPTFYALLYFIPNIIATFV